MRKFLVKVNGTDYEVEVEEIISSDINKPSDDSQKVPKQEGFEQNERLISNMTTKGFGVVVAPLPGTVVQVKVGLGQKVMQGETVLLLEAMKMQNEIASPIAGVVQEVLVENGDQVMFEQAMIRIG